MGPEAEVTELETDMETDYEEIKGEDGTVIRTTPRKEIFINEKGEQEERKKYILKRHRNKKKFRGCKTCNTQIRENKRFEIQEVRNEHFFMGRDDMPFHMLIYELIAKPKENPKEKMLSGCDVFFPDTLFFEKGAPKHIVMNDKDFCLSKWNENDEKKQTNL